MLHNLSPDPGLMGKKQTQRIPLVEACLLRKRKQNPQAHNHTYLSLTTIIHIIHIHPKIEHHTIYHGLVRLNFANPNSKTFPYLKHDDIFLKNYTSKLHMSMS